MHMQIITFIDSGREYRSTICHMNRFTLILEFGLCKLLKIEPFTIGTMTGMTTEIMTDNTIIQIDTMRRGLTTVLIVINTNSHQIIQT